MKERYIVGYTLLAAFIAFAVMFLLTRDIQTPENQAMPWQSYINDQDQTVVFDLTMGQSKLLDAARLFGTEIEASLFENENVDPELEVYFSSTKVGGISAKIILNLALNNQNIDILRDNIDVSMMMPSGVKKTTFKSKAESLMSRFTIKSLTFIPRADLPENVVIDLFGKPDRVDLSDQGISYWYYPEKGLKIIMDDEQKDILEFYNQ
ncbi:hypothetical protein [Candidatus Thioglobus sp.]|jgi:hypothetical protein|uniref:hypothetical protein n=1 Tax=Candidatus Thioglobus sp. TaxID=2026721 RepID=UPI0017576B66|nr:hypothetical protein [Candidatus Thioglobus sp.]HIF47324.1 hypothetical protein [Candidatus Thioglobus sp.]HIL02888.1 hypothetical protein [Candidatus Thioglobus autotrophicus]